MADVIGQDDPVAADIERLARAKKLIGKLGLKKLLAAAAGAVQHHDSIVDFAAVVAAWLAQRRIMDAQAGQTLATAKTKAGNLESPITDRPLRSIRSDGRCRRWWRSNGSRLKSERGKGRQKQEHAGLVTCFCCESKLQDVNRMLLRSIVLRLEIRAAIGACLGLWLASCAASRNGLPDRGVVSLPGLQYEVLRAGPPGPRPLRSDDVMVRYVGRLADGSIFSTSASDGTEPSTFSVRTVIPGFSALVQLMRPGDRWRFTIPSYLGYGHRGRRFVVPEATLKRDIPPDSILIFDVELVSITPGR